MVGGQATITKPGTIGPRSQETRNQTPGQAERSGQVTHRHQPQVTKLSQIQTSWRCADRTANTYRSQGRVGAPPNPPGLAGDQSTSTRPHAAATTTLNKHARGWVWCAGPPQPIRMGQQPDRQHACCPAHAAMITRRVTCQTITTPTAIQPGRTSKAMRMESNQPPLANAHAVPRGRTKRHTELHTQTCTPKISHIFHQTTLVPTTATTPLPLRAWPRSPQGCLALQELPPKAALAALRSPQLMLHGREGRLQRLNAACCPLPSCLLTLPEELHGGPSLTRLPRSAAHS